MARSRRGEGHPLVPLADIGLPVGGTQAPDAGSDR